jgi:archaellum component FlaC
MFKIFKIFERAKCLEEQVTRLTSDRSELDKHLQSMEDRLDRIDHTLEGLMFLLRSK